MSNIVPTNIQIPAHLARVMGQPSALATALAGGLAGTADFPRISIKGARFRIVEGGTETVLEDTKLSVVIVGANPRLSKTYYAKTWSPDSEPASPDCYSLDGLRPNPDSTAPQNDTCATCHARREELDENFQPGNSFFDHYNLALPSQPGLWHPDGQQIDENYNFTSLQLSRMGHKGIGCTHSM